MPNGHIEKRDEVLAVLQGLTIDEAKTILNWCYIEINEKQRKAVGSLNLGTGIKCNSPEDQEDPQRIAKEVSTKWEKVHERNRISLVLSGVSLGITIGYALSAIFL